MEGNRRNFIKKSSNPQFKKKGSARKGNRKNSAHEQSLEFCNASDTVYRILCQSKKIGSVIGKGGNIIKSLREETRATIKVADSVPGSDERVIMISSPPAKETIRKKNDKSDEDPTVENELVGLEPHCAAQDALLKVHDRIVEEDIGGTENGDGNEIEVTARLLVPNNMVGCLLGRKGDVIQRLRSETGANIRILPAEHLSACAMSIDELVQIKGEPSVAKKALYQVSTLLHQNPRKDRTSLSFPTLYGNRAFHRPGLPMADMPPSVDLMWSQHNPKSHFSPVPWAAGYGNRPSGFGHGDFDDGPSPLGGEIPSEFTMKILCPAGKIGGVIGNGGFNVRQLQLETGASIHVEDVSAESDERVIRVSSLEVLLNPRSHTIDAILQLQSKTSEFSEKGILTTRLLVPSSKVGCLLGQGGQVINEMRRRTQADIRVFSKEDKPKCASDDDELVQISGSIGVAKDALAEIASRLRTRCLRDANINAEHAPTRPVSGFGLAGKLPVGRPSPSVPIGAGASGRYELVKVGIHDYEHPSYPGPSTVMGYSDIRSSMDEKISSNAVGSVMGREGTNFNEIAETRLRLPNPQYGGSDYAELRGSFDHLSAPQSSFQSFAASAGQNSNLYHDAYQSHNAQQDLSAPKSSFQSFASSAGQNSNLYHDAYESHNAQQDLSAPQSSFQSFASSAAQNYNLYRGAAYHDPNAQQGAYPSISPSQLPYQSLNSQQASHVNTQQTSYNSISAQASYEY